MRSGVLHDSVSDNCRASLIGTSLKEGARVTRTGRYFFPSCEIDRITYLRFHHRPKVPLFLQFDILCFIKRRDIERYFHAISSSQEEHILFMYILGHLYCS